MWEQVQQRLRSRAVRSGDGRKTEAARSPLAGKLFDEQGEPLYVQGAAKGQRRYRYYVSKGLVRGESVSADGGWRLSATAIEQPVSVAAQKMLADESAISLALEESAIDASRLPIVLKSCRGRIERLRSAEAISALNELIERIEISREGFKLSLSVPLPLSNSGRAEQVSLVKFVPIEIRRRGVEMKMVLEGDATPARIDLPLLKAIARARRWSNELIAGTVASVDELAKREHLDRRSVRRQIRLGFLAPRIVEAIAEGRQPPELTVIALARRLDLPTLWSAQEVSLGIR